MAPLWTRLTVDDHPADTFRYRAEIMDALWRHGVHPSERTRPELVHEFVGDLYRYEIRRLRARLLAHAFPKREYAGRVIELRNRYRVIGLRPSDWIE